MKIANNFKLKGISAFISILLIIFLFEVMSIQIVAQRENDSFRCSSQVVGEVNCRQSDLLVEEMTKDLRSKCYVSVKELLTEGLTKKDIKEKNEG